LDLEETKVTHNLSYECTLYSLDMRIGLTNTDPKHDSKATRI